MLHRFWNLLWKGRAGDNTPYNFLKNNNVDPTDDELKLYKIYRSRIFEEDRLVNDRMTWMILSQAMFIAAFFLVTTSQTISQFRAILFTLITLGGLIISWLGIYSVRAARDEIEWLVAHYRFYHSKISNNNSTLPLVGQGDRHRHGHALSKHLPRLFFALWILLGVCAIFI